MGHSPPQSCFACQSLMGYYVFNISIVCLYHRLTNKERKSENRELPDNRAWMAWQGGEWPSIISNTLFFYKNVLYKNVRLRSDQN